MGHVFCPNCGASIPSIENAIPQDEVMNHIHSKKLQDLPLEKMRWFGFIIYFQLFVAAASCIINAISILTADVFQYLDLFADNFKPLKISYFIIMLFLGVDALITRYLLANFKEKGPQFYVRYLVVTAVATLIYMVWMNVILEDFDLWINHTFTVISIISNGIMAIASCVYFDKRAHLFIN